MASDWLDLPAPPALPGLYLRAALRRAVTGRTLPNQGLRCQVEVKPEHLARYRQICGFHDDGRLPSTYPHVLAFALQLKLLTGQGFPFPLLGLVHLENRIRVIRPLRGLGPFVVSVAVNNLAAHEKGAVFSLITRLQGPLGPLWEGDSRILCRDLKLEGPVIERSEEAALQLLEVDSWQAPANIGRAYAKGDKAAFDTIRKAGRTVDVLSEPVVVEMKKALQPIEKDWIEKAKKKGVADPQKLIDQLRADFAAAK